MRRLTEAIGHPTRVGDLVGRIDKLTVSYADVAATSMFFEALPGWMQDMPPVAAYTGMGFVSLVAGDVRFARALLARYVRAVTTDITIAIAHAPEQSDALPARCLTFELNSTLP